VPATPGYAPACHYYLAVCIITYGVLLPFALRYRFSCRHSGPLTRRLFGALPAAYAGVYCADAAGRVAAHHACRPCRRNQRVSYGWYSRTNSCGTVLACSPCFAGQARRDHGHWRGSVIAAPFGRGSRRIAGSSCRAVRRGRLRDGGVAHVVVAASAPTCASTSSSVPCLTAARFSITCGGVQPVQAGRCTTCRISPRVYGITMHRGGTMTLFHRRELFVQLHCCVATLAWYCCRSTRCYLYLSSIGAIYRDSPPGLCRASLVPGLAFCRWDRRDGVAVVTDLPLADQPLRWALRGEHALASPRRVRCGCQYRRCCLSSRHFCRDGMVLRWKRAFRTLVHLYRTCSPPCRNCCFPSCLCSILQDFARCIHACSATARYLPFILPSF